MHVLVTGATGFVGRAAVGALLSAGHEVGALVRDPSRATGLVDERAELIAGSAMDQTAVRSALEGRDALVQAAGVYSYQRVDRARVLADTPALARATLTAARDAGTPRVVDVSTVLTFTTAVARIDETTRLVRPGDPTWGDPYIRAKVEAEQIGRELQAAGLPRVTIHPGAVFGPGDVGPGQSGSIAIGLMRGGSTTNGRLGFADVRDVAAAIVGALTAPTASAYIVLAQPLTYREIAGRLDRLTGRRPRRRFIPHGALRVLARINDVAGGRLAPIPVAGAIEYILTNPPVIDGSRATRDLGVTYHDPDATLTDAIRWWLANGVIDRKLAGRLGA